MSTTENQFATNLPSYRAPQVQSEALVATLLGCTNNSTCGGKTCCSTGQHAAECCSNCVSGSNCTP